MAFELKPGYGTLFENKNKKESKHPDLVGKFRTPDGKTYEVSAWTIKKAGKIPYLSIAVKDNWTPIHNYQKPEDVIDAMHHQQPPKIKNSENPF